MHFLFPRLNSLYTGQIHPNWIQKALGEDLVEEVVHKCSTGQLFMNNFV